MGFRGAILLSAICAALLPAQDAASFFAQNCASCHTIGGGRLTGPDLKDVQQRKDRAWLGQFIANPQAALDRGDSYAIKLRDEARGVVMPTIPGLTDAMAGRLLDLIAAESKLNKSRFAGAQISDRPFTPVDVARGLNLFSGRARLASGAPPCISCHSAGTDAALGGGRLGPDLTKVYERLGGRKGLGNWLAAPATPTMQALFRRNPVSAEEMLPLLAAFEVSARQPQQPNVAGQMAFVLLGVAGAAAGMALAGAVWRQRFRGVRRPLVEAATRRVL